MATTHGIEYATYATALTYIDGLTDVQTQELLERLDVATSQYGPSMTARSAILSEFENATFSNRIVRSGSPTLYDCDPVAISVIDGILKWLETETGGYAFEYDPQRTQDLIWHAMALVGDAAALHTAEDLWSLAKACDMSSDAYFSSGNAWEICDVLAEHLKLHDVSDSGLQGHRYVEKSPLSPHHGFMTVVEYEKLRNAEGDMRREVSKAAEEWWRRFGNACGSFDLHRAVSCYQVVKSAHYFDDVIAARLRRHQGMPAVEKLVAVSPARAALQPCYPVSMGNREKREAFDQKELDAGYSPFGYWFSPEGEIYSMNAYQDHVGWIAKHLGVRGTDARTEAMINGWVSLTMATEMPGVANVSYMQDTECGKAIKTAARMVRRGGDFSTLVIEAYDHNYESVGYANYDDLRKGVRQLGYIARGDHSGVAPRPY